MTRDGGLLRRGVHPEVLEALALGVAAPVALVDGVLVPEDPLRPGPEEEVALDISIKQNRVARKVRFKLKAGIH